MKRSLFFTTLFWLTLIFESLAQQTSNCCKNYADATFGIASHQGAMSLSYVHVWKFGAHQKFGVGIGGRFTSYLASDQYYITAPSQLTSGSTSPLIIFKNNITANIDTFFVKS